MGAKNYCANHALRKSPYESKSCRRNCGTAKEFANAGILFIERSALSVLYVITKNVGRAAMAIRSGLQQTIALFWITSTLDQRGGTKLGAACGRNHRC